MLRDYLQLPVAVRILCFGSLLNRAGSFVAIFLTIYASEQMELGVTFATACMSAFGLGSMAGSMLGGHLADQWGRRRVMLVALFGGAALLSLIAVVQNGWVFMAAIGVLALVSEMYRPASSALIGDVVTIDRRPHAFALMYISINLGFAIAPTLGGILAEYSFRLLFWGDALTMAVYGLIILMFIEETRPVSNRQDEEAAEANDQLSSPQQSARPMFADVPFMLFCLACFLIALVFMQSISTLPIYIRQSGFSNVQFGLLMSINGVLIVVLQLPVTHWLSRFTAMSVVIAGGVLIAFGFGANGLGSSFAFLAFAICIWTAGEILQSPFLHSIVTNMAPIDLRGRYLGLFTMCYSSALMIGAPIGGELLLRFGPQVLWSTMFVVAMVAVGLYAALHRPVTERMEESAE